MTFGFSSHLFLYAKLCKFFKAIQYVCH
jgi:hypothetical protein